VRKCAPLALAAAPATANNDRKIDFIVFMVFFYFCNPVCPLITGAAQKVPFRATASEHGACTTSSLRRYSIDFSDFLPPTGRNWTHNSLGLIWDEC
jgi:hypothetical protein